MSATSACAKCSCASGDRSTSLRSFAAVSTLFPFAFRGRYWDGREPQRGHESAGWNTRYKRIQRPVGRPIENKSQYTRTRRRVQYKMFMQTRRGCVTESADWVCRGRRSVRPPWRTYAQPAPSQFYVAQWGDDATERPRRPRIRFAAEDVASAPRGGRMRSRRRRNSTSPNGGTTLRSGLADRGFGLPRKT